MDVQETIGNARDAISVKRVYGDPYEQDGVVFIPAAMVGGGGGGGSSDGDAAGNGSGAGAGFGLAARPVGAYVIENGNVRWEPAVDVNRLAQMALVAITVLALILGHRR